MAILPSLRKKPIGRGRPVGGLAVLCKKAQPLQKMHSGHHLEEGSSDNPRAPELNRELCLELFAAVEALGNRIIRMIFILGDCNFAPDDFPIDLLQGSQLNRPLSNVTYTSPKERCKLTGYFAPKRSYLLVAWKRKPRRIRRNLTTGPSSLTST
eukprot:6490968-Amphidinium_carterae.3